MKAINISKRKMKELKELELGIEVFNTEGKVYNLDYKGMCKILKVLHSQTGTNLANKMNTIQLLDEYRQMGYLPSTFYIPDAFASVSGEIVGFTIPRFEGIPLATALKDRNISTEDQLYYLRYVGDMLHRLERIRTKNPSADIYINDLQESNIMVNPVNGEIGVIDLDSCKIGNNICVNARFLTPNALLNYSNKYQKTSDDKETTKSALELMKTGEYTKKCYIEGHVIADANSDLYCYCIVILNYLFGESLNNMSLEQFYDYLNYLRKIGIGYNLLDIISKIVIDCDNENPYEYIEELTNEQVYKAKRICYKKLGGV